MAEVKGNGYTAEEIEYGKFLEELRDHGVVADGDKMMQEGGIGLIQPPEVKHTNAAIIASVPNAQQIYDKNEKLKGVILDLMARTSFRSDTEFKLFMDYVEWCEDFGVGYDGPLRWLVGLNSISGEARREYIDAITVTRLSNSRGYNGRNGSNLRPKYKDGELT